MKKSVCSKINKKYILPASMLLAGWSTNLFAGEDFSLPSPVSTVSSGNYITMFKEGAAELATLLIGVFGTLSMIFMAGLFVWEFMQVNDGKKTWVQLATTMSVGGLVLVIMYILLSIADGNNADGFTSINIINTVATAVA